MQDQNEITLDSLVGKHKLTGVETDTKELEMFDGCFEFVNVIKFILNGVTYMAVEEPNDGYRSYMDKIVITDDAVKNTFPPQEVLCAKSICEDEKMVHFYNTDSGKLLLVIGTAYTNDYYPVCVFDWRPENLMVNES